jgi:hypothetical protein
VGGGVDGGDAGAGTRRRLPGGGGGDPGRRLPAARVGPVGEFPHAVLRVPGGGSCEAVGGPHGGRRPRARCRGLFFPRRPLRPRRGARWRSARFCRRLGGAGAVGRAPQPRRCARPSVERGTADSWRPRVARLPGGAPSSAFFVFLVFCARSLQRNTHRSWVVGDRSSSTAPVTNMAPSIR